MRFDEQGLVEVDKVIQVSLSDGCRKRLKKLVNAAYKRKEPRDKVSLSGLISEVIEGLMDRREAR